MEVEIKLRLPDAAAHERLCAALEKSHLRTHEQENLFFDGANRQLAAGTAALRLRFYDYDARCVLSLKCRPRMAGGISRVEETEEDLDPAVGRSCADDPSRLAELDSAIMRRVTSEFGVGGRKGPPLALLGGFRNTRAVYAWEEQGLKLEVDETRFDFGTSYEVECETAEPERVKAALEMLLKEAGVPYSYSEANKFAMFYAGKLLP